MPKEKSEEFENKEDEDSEESENVYEDFETFIPDVTPVETPDLVLESGEIQELPPDLEAGVEALNANIRVADAGFGETRETEQGERVYNMPDYGRDYELIEQRERQEGIDREMVVGADMRKEVGDNIKTINFGQWQRGAQEPEMRRRISENEEYETYRLKRAETGGEGLPFEEKKSKKRVF